MLTKFGSISIFKVVFLENVMIIKIAGLSEGSHSYQFNESVNKLELGSPFSENITVDVELNKSHNQVILNVDLKASAVFECDRCNKVFEKKLNPVYKVVYFFGNEPEDNIDTNIVYLQPDADKINIAPEMRDYALLAIPMKKLCREDCKGLCPVCGTDLNEADCGCEKNGTDSRWLPLMDLKKKINNN